MSDNPQQGHLIRSPCDAGHPWHRPDDRYPPPLPDATNTLAITGSHPVCTAWPSRQLASGLPLCYDRAIPASEERTMDSKWWRNEPADPDTRAGASPRRWQILNRLPGEEILAKVPARLEEWALSFAGVSGGPATVRPVRIFSDGRYECDEVVSDGKVVGVKVHSGTLSDRDRDMAFAATCEVFNPFTFSPLAGGTDGRGTDDAANYGLRLSSGSRAIRLVFDPEDLLKSALMLHWSGDFRS